MATAPSAIGVDSVAPQCWRCTRLRTYNNYPCPKKDTIVAHYMVIQVCLKEVSVSISRSVRQHLSINNPDKSVC